MASFHNGLLNQICMPVPQLHKSAKQQALLQEYVIGKRLTAAMQEPDGTVQVRQPWEGVLSTAFQKSRWSPAPPTGRARVSPT